MYICNKYNFIILCDGIKNNSGLCFIVFLVIYGNIYCFIMLFFIIIRISKVDGREIDF